MKIIRVTQEDINTGIFHFSECPIALALLENFPKATINVGRLYIEINNEKYKNSSRIMKFIDNFDDGIQVFPIEIQLDEQNKLAQ